MATLLSSVGTADQNSENTVEETLIPEATNCIYTSCYCEENVWHLCDKARQRRQAELKKCYCVFISNIERMIPLWCQRASSQEDGCVLWRKYFGISCGTEYIKLESHLLHVFGADYHVIFIYKDKSRTEVFDLDSTKNFPCPFQDYVNNAIRSDGPLKPNYRRMFRVIPATTFLDTFASDRSHMLDPEGQWMKPPPSYPCIQTKESANNIQDFINMDPAVGEGKVLNYWQFCDFFNSTSS